MANQAGKSYALTAFTPMHPESTPILRMIFKGIGVGLWRRQTEELIALRFIHFARWVIIPGSAFPRLSPEQPQEHLHYDYLLFCSNFNGDWENYIDAFSEMIPGGMDNIWRWSLNFPGARPVGPFIDYIHSCQLETTYYYNAYPGATTRDILESLSVVAEYERFALEADSLTPDEFDRAYAAFLGRAQTSLGQTGPRV